MCCAVRGQKVPGGESPPETPPIANREVFRTWRTVGYGVCVGCKKA